MAFRLAARSQQLAACLVLIIRAPGLFHFERGCYPDLALGFASLVTGSLKTPPLLASQVLADLGPVLTGERDLQQTATAALELVMSAGRINSGALFRFQEKPAMLSSIASSGFVLFPKIAVFPLLPKHIHALSRASGPQRLCEERCDTFLSSTGNFSGVWFRYLVPLQVRGKL